MLWQLKQTFDGHFALPIPRMSVQLDLDGHLTYRLVHAWTWFNAHPDTSVSLRLAGWRHKRAWFIMQRQYERGMQVLEVRLGSDLPTWAAQSDKTKMYKGRAGGEGEEGGQINETYPCWAVFFHWELT